MSRSKRSRRFIIFEIKALQFGICLVISTEAKSAHHLSWI